MDNCCREYLFICDFFLVSGTGAQTLFDAIMGKTLSLFLVRIYVNRNSLTCHLYFFDLSSMIANCMMRTCSFVLESLCGCLICQTVVRRSLFAIPLTVSIVLGQNI